MNTANNTFGAHLKALRKAAGLAQQLDCGLTALNISGSLIPDAYVLTVPVESLDKAVLILNIIANMADDGGAE